MVKTFLLTCAIAPILSFGASITGTDGYLTSLRVGGSGSLSKSLITNPNGTTVLYNFPTGNGLPNNGSPITVPPSGFPGGPPIGPNPIPPTFGVSRTATWDTQASANFGVLKARVQLSTGTGTTVTTTPSLSLLGNTWEVGEALQADLVSYFEDTWTVNTGSTGQLTNLILTIALTGSFTATTATPGSTYGQVYLGAYGPKNGNFGRTLVNGPGTYQFTVPVISGQATALRVFLNLKGYAGLGSTIDLDYFNTAVLSKVEAEQNGQKVNFTVQTESNSSSYGSAVPTGSDVPEPGSVLLMLGALPALEWIRRRR